MAAVGIGIAVYLVTGKAAAMPKVVPTPDPGEPGKRDPTTKLPSTQFPKPTFPKPKPRPPAPEPPPGVSWGDAELVDFGTLYLVLQESNEGKWRYSYEPVPFVEPFYVVKGGIASADGFASRQDALGHAANFGLKRIDYEILENITTATGKRVVYYDHGFGVVMDHVADPLSPTGVAIHWAVFSQDVTTEDGPFASGSDSTEAAALQAVEGAMVQA